MTRRKRAPITRVTKNSDTLLRTEEGGSQSNNAHSIDNSFFSSPSNLSARPFVQGPGRHGQTFSRTRSYPHQNIVNDDGTPLEGRRARIASVLAANGGELDGKGSKKHFKGNKRMKQRSGKGYD